VAGVYAVGHDGTLQPVHLGASRQVNEDEEMPFRYASAPLLTGDGRRVGSVTFTDH
jgi:hypothetical protein